MAQQQAERHGKAKAFSRRTKEALLSAARFASRHMFLGRAALLDNALMEAAKKGDIAKINRLLKIGAKINSLDSSFGSTALHCAAANGRTQACALLIQKGADVNAKDSEGKTPLIVAAGNGETETCILLIENGADVKATYEHYLFPKTASEHALQYNHKDTSNLLAFMELLAAANKEAPAAFLKSFRECYSS